jgi:NitT/TauT family transport system ATP-binding protein
MLSMSPPMVSAISLCGVWHAFRSAGRASLAVQDVGFTVSTGEFVCLLGPSGCGKSTLLNLIAGFLRPLRGRIQVAGRAIDGAGPDRGVVFQQFALFPWLTAIENVEFGLRMAGVAKAERRMRAQQYLAMVGLAGHEEKFPARLSGGMKQRVAIARALVNDPAILLMDEPFGALDAQTREIMQEELIRITGQERKTVVFVTHSISEAVFLSDRVVIMTAAPGRVKAIVDVPLDHPRDKFSADFTALESHLNQLLRDEIKRAGVL